MPELIDSKSIADAIMAGKKMFLHTYHCGDIPALKTPFGDGFPDVSDRVPLQCPCCDGVATNLEELKFSVWCD